MKKLLLSLLLSLISVVSFSQYVGFFPVQTVPSYGFSWNVGKFRSALIVPPILSPLVSTDEGGIATDAHHLYFFNGTTWVQVDGGGQNIYNTSATITDEDRFVTIRANRALYFVDEDATQITRTVHGIDLFDVTYRNKDDGNINKMGVGSGAVYLSVSDALNAHQNSFSMLPGGPVYAGGITGQKGIRYSADYSALDPLTLVTNQWVAGQLAALNLQQVNTNGNETTLPIKYFGESVGTTKYSWLYGADDATRAGDPDFPDITYEFKWMLPRGSQRSHLITAGIEKRSLATSLGGVFADQYGDLNTDHLPFFYRHDGFMYNDNTTYNPDYGINEPDDGSRDVDCGDLYVKFTNSPGYYWEAEASTIKMTMGLPIDGWKVETPVTSLAVINGVAINRSLAKTHSVFDMGDGTTKGFFPTRLNSTQIAAIGGLTSGDDGLTTYNTTSKSYSFYDGTSWVDLLSTSSGVITSASNLGGGLSNYSTQVGNQLRFNSFLASDFNLASNLISIDYTNGQAATNSVPGFLSAADHTNFATAFGWGNHAGLYSLLGHVHSAADITSGTLPIARGGTNLTALGSALQMLRVNSGATALEYFTPAFAATSHTHDAADIVSGTIDVARIGTGTPTGAKYLAGDNAWTTFPTIPTVTPSALTKTDDSNVTLTLGGSPSTSLLAATSLTLGWTGQLPISRGGTGLSSLGTANQMLRVNAGATALEYFTLPTYLLASNNLSDLANAGTARTNLGLGTAATQANSFFAQTANNLSDLANAGTARTNLGLGSFATLSALPASGVTAGTYAKANITVGTDGLITAASQGDDDIIEAYAALGSQIVARPVGLSNANITTNVTMSDGGMNVIAVWLPKDRTLTGVKWYQTLIGNYTGDNENRIGLYTLSGTTFTLVASTTNDASLWQTTSTSNTGNKAFSSTYAATRGLYFVACLYNNSAQVTGPTIGGAPVAVSTGAQRMDFSNSVGLSFTVGGNATLPATFSTASITNVTTRPVLFLYQ